MANSDELPWQFVRARGRQGSSLPCMRTPPGVGDGSPTPAKKKKKKKLQKQSRCFVSSRGRR
ncbi:hypothetical protein Scep_009943 [Stephania cephalantha]|uniref:Uncharacterized protein n=1 Tax=Stephania cephalantha TaxID=152367 RepID=A0AAP0JU61_9MAGN